MNTKLVNVVFTKSVSFEMMSYLNSRKLSQTKIINISRVKTKQKQ